MVLRIVTGTVWAKYILKWVHEKDGQNLGNKSLHMACEASGGQCPIWGDQVWLAGLVPLSLHHITKGNVFARRCELGKVELEAQ